MFLVPSRSAQGGGLLTGADLRRVPWDVLLLFGGGLALAEAIQGSGLSDYLAGIFGGIGSPFSFLYSLPIINGAGLLFGAGAVTSAVFAALAYDLLIVGLASGVVPTPDYPVHAPVFDLHVALTVFTTNATFILVAYLAAILTRRIYQAERLLTERQAERGRGDKRSGFGHGTLISGIAVFVH